MLGLSWVTAARDSLQRSLRNTDISVSGRLQGLVSLEHWLNIYFCSTFWSSVNSASFQPSQSFPQPHLLSALWGSEFIGSSSKIAIDSPSRKWNQSFYCLFRCNTISWLRSNYFCTRRIQKITTSLVFTIKSSPCGKSSIPNLPILLPLRPSRPRSFFIQSPLKISLLRRRWGLVWSAL